MIYGPIPKYYRKPPNKYNLYTGYRTPHESELIRAWFCIAYEIPDRSIIISENNKHIRVVHDFYYPYISTLILAIQIIISSPCRDVDTLKQIYEDKYVHELNINR